MPTSSYIERRWQLETYFDRTAAEAWKRLTSDAPVGRIRATVRAGRDEMRNTLVDWLPADLHGARVLDAGCGTGSLSIDAARRGAHVVAVDISQSLIKIADERAKAASPDLEIDFKVGDMLAPALGKFDHVVAMDSLIHYQTPDIVRALAMLLPRVRKSVLFTVAPRTPLLTVMHTVGRAFPRSDRAPAIVPVRVSQLQSLMGAEKAAQGWRIARTRRIARGFYISHAVELVRT
jgi:magnesium-protoporphyrin O-methyltransferase